MAKSGLRQYAVVALTTTSAAAVGTMKYGWLGGVVGGVVGIVAGCAVNKTITKIQNRKSKKEELKPEPEKPSVEGAIPDALICPRCGAANTIGNTQCSYCGQEF